MKDKLTKAAVMDRPQRPKFVPCERETYGGAQKPGNGTTCCGGMLFFWSSYQGQMVRRAKDCSCRLSWLAGFTGAIEAKNPQPALRSGDAKAKAAGE